MANDKFATTENEDDFQPTEQASGALSGWRIEKNTNGYYRYRWQNKDERGRPDTYITSSGSVGYRRGSRYLPKLQAFKELENGKKRS